jgi:hypothetical protein
VSQAGYDPSMKVIFGSTSKTSYEPYTDEELDSVEFFWNQLRVIVDMRNMEYFYHFVHERSKYIDRTSGM